jgi:NifB/MoaA-like Fe-S oxidoreductase
VGLTGYREGLTKLEPFDRDSARETIEIIKPFQEECLAKYGDRIVYPSDELYLLAEEELPSAEDYGDLKQLENGVGMVSLFEDELLSALDMEDGDEEERYADVVTGLMSYGMISRLMKRIEEKFTNTHITVHGVRNDFFGPTITVSGLLTATDILAQVKREDVRGDRIILPESVLRRDGDRFLDDVTKEEFEERMGLPIRTNDSGGDLLDAVLGR